MIPSMWREELLHPFLAHLPITLIPLSLGLRIAAFALRSRPRWNYLLPAYRTLLPLAVAGAWVALFTGEIAEDVVNRVICDPTVTDSHEEWAEWTLRLVGLALLLELPSYPLPLFARLRERLSGKPWGIPALGPALATASVLCLAGAAAALVQTGHLGATLVYQQGAAVYHPTPECKEFE